jgi:hypothetical protein
MSSPSISCRDSSSAFSLKVYGLISIPRLILSFTQKTSPSNRLAARLVIVTTGGGSAGRLSLATAGGALIALTISCTSLSRNSAYDWTAVNPSSMIVSCCNGVLKPQTDKQCRTPSKSSSATADYSRLFQLRYHLFFIW